MEHASFRSFPLAKHPSIQVGHQPNLCIGTGKRIARLRGCVDGKPAAKHGELGQQCNGPVGLTYSRYSKPNLIRFVRTVIRRPLHRLTQRAGSTVRIARHYENFGMDTGPTLHEKHD